MYMYSFDNIILLRKIINHSLCKVHIPMPFHGMLPRTAWCLLFVQMTFYITNFNLCSFVHAYSYPLFEKMTCYSKYTSKVFFLSHIYVYSYPLFVKTTCYISNMNKVVLLCVHVNFYSYSLFVKMTCYIRNMNKVILLCVHIHVYYSLYVKMTCYSKNMNNVFLLCGIPYIHIFPGLILTTLGVSS